VTTSESCGWFSFFEGNELKLAEAAGPRADFKLFFEEEGKAVMGEEEEGEEEI
jgi:hypothetical protein